MSRLHRPQGFFDKFLAWFNDDFQKWRNESNKWQVIVMAGSEEAQARLRRPTHTQESIPDKPMIIWTSGPAENRSASEFMFETHRPMNIVVKCTGFGSRRIDQWWLDRKY